MLCPPAQATSRALGGLLSADVAHIGTILRSVGQHSASVHAYRGEGLRHVDEIHGLGQIADGKNVDALDDGGLARVGFRHDHGLDLVLPRRERRRKRPTHRTNLPVKRQLAQKNILIEPLAEERALASEDRKRHRQIEGRAFLADIRRCKIDGNALQRKIVAAIFQRRLDAFAALFYGNVRQAHDIEIAGLARSHINLDFHEVGIDTKHGCAEVFEMHSVIYGDR